jgi:hypothetical protein
VGTEGDMKCEICGKIFDIKSEYGVDDDSNLKLEREICISCYREEFEKRWESSQYPIQNGIVTISSGASGGNGIIKGGASWL